MPPGIKLKDENCAKLGSGTPWPLSVDWGLALLGFRILMLLEVTKSFSATRMILALESANFVTTEPKDSRWIHPVSQFFMRP